jgi:hypothetical protein
LNSGTTYNASMPLPLNIRYTYITSNLSNSGQDGLVETSRQWLYSGSTATPASADTLFLTINHADEPNNILSIIRGLDEPDDTAFAYSITPGQATQGFITPGTNWNTTDKDVFRVIAPSNGSLTISLTSSSSGIDSLAVFTNTGELSRKSAGDGTTSIVINGAVAGQAYYVYVRGTASSSTYLHPYSVTASLTPTSVKQCVDVRPDRFQLFQNYPNPFNPTTVISYELLAASDVSLKILDMLGREVATLTNEKQNEGTYSVRWNATNVPSGMYFCRLRADGFSETIRISLVR